MIAALLNHLWQSTLFCGVVWLITLGLRSNRAALRHWLWMLASLKFLVPFAALYFLGALAGLPTPVGNQPVLFDQAIQVAAPVVSPTLSSLDAGPNAGNGTSVALLVVWLAGVGIVALRWALAWRAAELIVRAARPAPGTAPDTRITDADIEPAVARTLRPVVLLPAALLGRLSSPQLSAVLAHEHEHIARRDNLKANLHRVVETLFWFHPAVWWIGRQLLEERERACDEAVLDYGHDGADYAAGILEVCRHCGARAPIALAATSGDLAQRVRWILVGARPASLGVVKALSLLVGVLAVGLVPMFAGAAEHNAHRFALLSLNTKTLWSAEISISPSIANGETDRLVIANRNVVQIHNSTLRELVALAYGVERWEIRGGPWLDDQRYDILAVASQPVSEPENLDPNALRGAITKLLAAEFDLEVRINSRCQAPCGRYALAESHTT